MNSQKSLYGTLPFFATFGMQHKEHSVYDLFANIRLRSYESLPATDVINSDRASQRTENLNETVIALPLIIGILMTVPLQFLVGYNMSACNGTVNMIFPDHTMWDWTIVVSAYPIGAPLGAFLGGQYCNGKGRRKTLLLSTLLYLFGGLVMTCAMDIYWLMIGRLLTGIGAGVATIIVPVYLGEIAPPTLRGTLGTVTLCAQYLGVFMSVALVFPLRPYTAWRAIFGLQVILCILQLFLSPFLLESPRWLLGRNENSKLARNVIRQLRGYRTDEEVEDEVANFLYGAIRHKTKRKSAHSVEAMWDMACDRDYRSLVLAVMFLQIARQLSGFNILVYYSTVLYEQAQLEHPVLYSALGPFVTMCAVYLALKLIPVSERRTLLLLSSMGMFLSSLALSGGLLGYLHKAFVVSGAMALSLSFTIGLGPIPALLIAEMFEAKYVATAMALMSIVTWTSNILLSLLFLPMCHYLKAFVFLPSSIVLAVTFVTIYLYLPETLGRTVDEVQKMLSMNPEDLLNVIVDAVEVEDFMDVYPQESFRDKNSGSGSTRGRGPNSPIKLPYRDTISAKY